MIYSAGFNIADTTLALGTITFDIVGESPVVVTLSSITSTGIDGSSTSQFFHAVDSSQTCTSQDGTSTTRLGRYAANNFAYALQTALRTAAAAWAAESNITVTWSTTTGLLTIGYTGAACTVDWSTTAGRALCGFTANLSGAQSYTSTAVPTYVIVPTLLATSDSSPNYEPDQIANHIISDTGVGYGISRESSPLCRDWVQQYETLAKTFALNAASTHPWTFEHLFKHCRGQFPFVVLSGFGDAFHEAFSFRSEGTSWRPERASPGNASQFHIPFRAWVEGTFG